MEKNEITKQGNEEVVSYVAYDLTPPTIKITSPKNNTTIEASEVELKWSATDNIGISHYEIYINGTLITKTTNTSITIRINETALYRVAVRAVDMAGNTDQQEIYLTVKVPTINVYLIIIPILILAVVIVVYTIRRRTK